MFKPKFEIEISHESENTILYDRVCKISDKLNMIEQSNMKLR